jgi:hypothetical protein
MLLLGEDHLSHTAVGSRMTFEWHAARLPDKGVSAHLKSHSGTRAMTTVSPCSQVISCFSVHDAERPGGHHAVAEAFAGDA